jgi:hypothetical protein
MVRVGGLDEKRTKRGLLFISDPWFGRLGTPGIHPARPMLGPPGPDIGTTHPDPGPRGEVRPAPGPSRPDAGNERKTKTENAHPITL